MSKRAIQFFIHQQDAPLFISNISKIAKTLLENPRDYTSRKSFENLLNNYKAYNTHYNKNPDVLSTVAF